MKAVHLLPKLVVKVNGVSLSLTDPVLLAEVHIQQRLSVPDLCEILLCPREGTLAHHSHWEPGHPLRVSLDDAAPPLFEGVITALEYQYGSNQQQGVRIRAYDRLHGLRQQRPSRTYVQVTLSELAQDMVSPMGIEVPDLQTPPFWPYLIQADVSNLTFLQRLAESCGFYFRLSQGALSFVRLDGRGTPLPLVWGDTLVEARYELNQIPQCGAVSTLGWNPLENTIHHSRVRVADAHRTDGFDRAVGHSVRNQERYHLNQLFYSDRHAEVMAQAAVTMSETQAEYLWGRAIGNPELHPGTRITVKGLAPPLPDSFGVTAVNHSITSQTGYVTEFSTQPPSLSPLSQATLTAPGIVSQISDPQHLGRVRVTLPTYDDVETDWMEVMLPGAGHQKGLVMLPDIGDQVLILFPHGNLSQGIVLGGLFGHQSAPDWGLVDQSVQRYTVQTPGGQWIQLDDAHQRIHLQNSHGSSIEMTPETVRIHAGTALEISAPGQPVVISGDSIDFRRA